MPTEQTKKKNKKQKTRRELRSTNCPSTWLFLYLCQFYFILRQKPHLLKGNIDL